MFWISCLSLDFSLSSRTLFPQLMNIWPWMSHRSFMYTMVKNKIIIFSNKNVAFISRLRHELIIHLEITELSWSFPCVTLFQIINYWVIVVHASYRAAQSAPLFYLSHWHCSDLGLFWDSTTDTPKYSTWICWTKEAASRSLWPFLHLFRLNSLSLSKNTTKYQNSLIWLKYRPSKEENNYLWSLPWVFANLTHMRRKIEVC